MTDANVKTSTDTAPVRFGLDPVEPCIYGGETPCTTVAHYRVSALYPDGSAREVGRACKRHGPTALAVETEKAKGAGTSRVRVGAGHAGS